MADPGHRPIGFAHRGASALAPENTIGAFRLAIELGATGLESDVHLAIDGTPMLVHDPEIDGPGGPIPVAGQTVRELRDRGVPALADLYVACGTSWPLSLDLNDARPVDAAMAVIASARRAGPDAVGRLLLCHERVDTLAEIGRRAPGIALVHSTDLEEIPPPGAHARGLVELGIRVLNLHHDDWTATGDARAAVAEVHAAGCRAFAWDTQVLSVARDMVAAAADGLYADDPQVLVEAIAGA